MTNILTKISKFFTGKTVPAKNKRSFQVANVDRLTSSWTSSQTNINADIRSGNKVLRARARDLAENDPYARKFLRMLEKNVIGPEGFTFQNKSYDWIKDAETGEAKKQYDKFANSIIEEAFAEWSGLKNATITQDVTLREATAVELKTIAIDGEVFLYLIEGKNAENRFGFTYQQIDPALCDEMLNGAAVNGNRIIMGIEYDSYMRPTAYYFKKISAQTSVYMNYYGGSDYVRIPAENIIHLFKKEFVGQLRGISWFLPTAYRLNILKGYQEAVLMNARSAALKTGILTPRDTAGELAAADIAGGEENSESDIVYQLEPGTIFKTPEGYDFDSFDPAYPSGSEGPFTQSILQGIAAGWDVDYPTLASNFRDVNYTSARVGTNDSNAGYQTLQIWLINHKLKPLFERFLEMAILSGAVNLPMAKFEKFNKPLFLGYRAQFVDPWKEAKADDYAVKNNLETLEKILARRGYTLEEFIEQKKLEKKLLEDAGLLEELKADAPDETPNGNIPEDDAKMHPLNLELERKLKII